MTKNAVVGLVRGHSSLSGYDMLIERNRLCYENVLSMTMADLLLFHEGNIPKAHQDFIQGKCKAALRFVDIRREFFEVSSLLTDPEQMREVGYKNMCRFYGVKVYQLLDDYDYYMRLDDDSFVRSKLPFDMFAHLAEKKGDYIYRVHADFEPHQPTSLTLPVFVKQYLASRGIDYSGIAINTENGFNSFHVTSLAFWRRPEVREFLRAVDDSRGFYWYRWGDSPLQYLCLKLFSDPSKRILVDNFDYENQSLGQTYRSGESQFKRKTKGRAEVWLGRLKRAFA